MTLQIAVLSALHNGPLSRPEIERKIIELGFAPAGVPKVLWQLKKAGDVHHLQRASRHRRSIYASAD